MPLPLIFGLLRKAAPVLTRAPFFGIGLYIAYSKNVARVSRLERTAVAARVGNVGKDLLDSELVLTAAEKETWVENQDDTDYLPWLNNIIREFWPKLSLAVAGEVKNTIRNILEGMPNLPLSLQVQEFTLGEKSPKLSLELLPDDDQPSKISRVQTAKDSETVTFDVGLEWDGDPEIKLSIKLGILPITAELKNLKLTDTVLRVSIMFEGSLPIVKCITIMMLRHPVLDFDLDLFGLNLSSAQTTQDQSFVQEKVEAIIDGVLGKMLVFPSYMGPIVINTPVQGEPDADGKETINSMLAKILPPTRPEKYNYLRPGLPIGYLYIRPVRAYSKIQDDRFSANDSYVHIEVPSEPRGQAFADKAVSSVIQSNEPDWSARGTPEPFMKFMICSLERKVQGSFTARLYDKDKIGDDDLLGECDVFWAPESHELQFPSQPTLELAEDVDLRKPSGSSGSITLEHVFVPFGQVRMADALSLPGIASKEPTSALTIVLYEYKYAELFSQAQKEMSYVSKESHTLVKFRLYCDCAACADARMERKDTAACPSYRVVRSAPQRDTVWPRWSNEVHYVEGLQKDGLNLDIVVVDLDETEAQKGKNKTDAVLNTLTVLNVVQRIREKEAEFREKENNDHVIYTLDEPVGTGEYFKHQKTGEKYGGPGRVKLDLVWRETEYIK
eukprot:CAMPEP_0118937336 /NCGR_PEP_ID=MMETSP1169-20130426/22371_1 /TAXON_ID=36882 /ORGANISM="Pyramimonas obovata, Strain CCMP722" /LENGTH=670 /DNA_ID=CAMNT_0006880929 /DNA_START=127 /DNA_END=2139 /DNA_ORIENTATION=+